jgi:para-nitrobenzyl esterase
MADLIEQNNSRAINPPGLLAIGLTLCMLLGASVTRASEQKNAAAPTVSITQGVLAGVNNGYIESFKGIPYAAPPIGDLRWRPPQLAHKWSGIRDADRFGNDCTQIPVSWDDTPPTTQPSEDCLYLNVWRPHAAARLPVLVWIHGGGFVNGASSAALYDGAHFAKDGIVFVSINYRLGRFGFFAHPALTAEHPDEPKGNYGYMDQIAALRWVHDNIAAFGGNPDQVTIMGESAGGASVLMLLNAPGARGLFARAIAQSGGGSDFSLNERISEFSEGKVPAEEIGIAFAKSVGIEGRGAQALRAMRKLRPMNVAGDLNMETLFTGKEFTTYPDQMIDGKIVISSLLDIYAKRLQAKVPLLIGATGADISFFAARTKDDAFAAFGPAEAAARKAYDVDSSVPLEQLIAKIGADRYMVEPARFAARAFAATGVAVYEYRFTYVPPGLKATSPHGAGHFSDVPFVFETQDLFKGGQTSPGDAAVAAQIHAYWVNFTKSGDPNGPGLALWPRYLTDRDELLEIGEHEAKAMADPWKERLDAVSASNGSIEP